MRLFKRKKYSDYVVDLGKLHRNSLPATPIKDTETQGVASEFLSDFASAAQTQENSNADSDANDAFQSRIIDDGSERLAILSDRVYRMIERIDLLEHKLERLERKFGFRENL